MSWKRHFRVIKGTQQALPNPLDSNRYGGGSGVNSNLSSYLPLVYAGHPNRIQRYYQFDDMDKDSDINAALDTIADFCTQSEEQFDEPFEVHYNSDPNESETKIIKTMMDKWSKLNNFRSRLWYMFRDTLKNGDAFYLRDPETQEWLWLDHFMVEMVKVDDTMGKKPDEYLIRGLDYNRQTQYGTKKADPNQYRTPYGTSNVGAARVSAVSSSSGPAAFSLAGTAVDPRQRHMMGPFAQEVAVVDAKFVVHLSLSIGNDINWPFGPSILEPIFKTFKQKELLEDAIIIYRVQRAPERRIFYIDTGTMPPERAKRHIEAIKNDIHQRRIPNRTGTGGCFDMNTRVPLLDGRTLSIAELAAEHEAGKVNWAYSCDPETGAIAPGKITWAGITHRDAEVIKLTLDNGQTIICTPEHNFPILGRGKTEAKDIEIGIDSLVSFNTRLHSINEYRDGPMYQQVYDHGDKKWKFTHRMVGGFMKALGRQNEKTYSRVSDKKTVLHHDDFDKYNNTPDNLFYMNGYDHFLLHAEMTPQFMETLTEEQRRVIGEKKSVGGLRSWANAKPERWQAAKDRFMKNCAEQQQKPWVNQANVWNDELFAILVATVKATGGGKRETAAALSTDEQFMMLYRELNRPTGKTIVHLDYEKLSVTTLEKLIKDHGFSGWREFLHDCGFEVRKPTLGLKTDHQLLSAIVETAKSMDVPNLAEVCKRLSADQEFMSRFAALNTDTKGMSNKSKISINTMKVIIGKHGFGSWTDFRQKLSCFNHKVVAIEHLADKMNVGTLTIDGTEEYHGHHTFALEQGVFTFNSILDAAYNPLSINDDYFFAQCERLDTKVPLLDGRTLTLQEIIDEYHEGETNWVSSMNLATQEFEPGRICWAGVTRRNAELVRVTLDNGEHADTTPDHRFILRDGAERQAAHLVPGDSLMPAPGDPEHTVKFVAWLPFTEDTGDITVESPSGSHVFALACGVYVHNSQDGRGSKVETLPGGDGNNEILDLMFFSRKLARGLRVPVSYLNLGEDEGNSSVTFNDGKLGAAMIQEYRFTKFCMRLQSLLAPVFDKQFKSFLVRNGVEMEWSLFDLRFAPPQSFTRYRQIELDSQRMQVYAGVSENRRLSERFKFTRYLGLTEDELIENEKLWSEENAAKLKQKTGASPAESEAGAGLGDVGLHAGGDELPPDDLEMSPEEGADQAGMPPQGGAPGEPAPGGAPPAAGGAGMGGPGAM